MTSDNSNLGLSLGIETDRLEACINEANTKAISGLFGSPGWGFKQDNLDFLTQTPDVESIHFWDVELKNIDGLYSLKNLRSFLLDGKRPGIDFARFSKIESITWSYNKKDTNLKCIEAAKNFYLWHFNPKDKSFSSLELPVTLKKLEVNWANPTDLQGLPRLPHLQEIEFHLCRNLRSLDGLELISPKLRRVIVSRCKKLKDLKALNVLENLKDVFIDDERLTR